MFGPATARQQQQLQRQRPHPRISTTHDSATAPDGNSCDSIACTVPELDP